jgi:hypothetical protein
VLQACKIQVDFLFSFSDNVCKLKNAIMPNIHIRTETWTKNDANGCVDKQIQRIETGNKININLNSHKVHAD